VIIGVVFVGLFVAWMVIFSVYLLAYGALCALAGSWR
jgi:hypothetical protein